ncbi:glycosyltransferase family 92 protein At1g27200 [Mercurialis annua]|uniref:glycosyltransferase family 92 protein At1g27200 n=1 Tax=Mercurialis annua TaxID=3986 RepID=UPI00216104CE|nr:glycosyltransferase family 92 protein At1g27200 [Mercurialis annua]
MTAAPIKKSPSAPLLYLLSVGRSSGGAGTGAGPYAASNLYSVSHITETMKRAVSAVLLFCFVSVFLCVSFSLYSSRYPIYAATPLLVHQSTNNLIQDLNLSLPHPPRTVSIDSNFIPSVSVLFPGWEVLLVVSSPEVTTIPNNTDHHKFTCLYPNNVASPARFSGILPSTNQITFKCSLPRNCRRRLPFLAPLLTRLSDKELPVPWPPSSPPVELLRWNKLVYESFSTEDDVVLFAKGLNNRQGINRSPDEFECVFVDGINAVRTAVTSSIQEVFRCRHPDLTPFFSGAQQGENNNEPIKLKVSLEIIEGRTVIPTLAYYTPYQRKIAESVTKSELCAATMVYNVGKFLKEWVMYHSKIGVDKFILYDNESDDDLISVVKELNQQGFNVQTLLWIWPKTQEAGFSHAALLAGDSCKWMMYVDVDEFVFSPSWETQSQPSDQMLKSLLPSSDDDYHSQMTGEVSIKCNEFGPSNRKSHPAEGVTQGYDCRRRLENRHKSIVLIEAIDDSLLNVIHHFSLKEQYRMIQLRLETAVVSHYKYQAWSEFKAKFRRRVSSYVVDWNNTVNLASQDRTPGLGHEAVEPPGWENMFCEVRDDRLKLLTQKWFGTETESGFRMAWQS